MQYMLLMRHGGKQDYIAGLTDMRWPEALTWIVGLIVLGWIFFNLSQCIMVIN